MLDSLRPTSIPCGDVLRSTADTAAHWAGEGLHALAQLPAKCAAAAAAAAPHPPCDLHSLLAAAGPAGEHAPRSGPAHARAMAHRAPGPSRPCPAVPERDFPTFPKGA